jgi:hypothetical protein
MSKTAIWDSLKRVPKEHLKPFKRSGGFTGTAIKPMWTFHRMTEEFGPCGTGWGVCTPDFNVQPAGNEILVYCIVHVWYGDHDHTVCGVGGDKILSVGNSGPRTDDEAFKKAFTDAVTNALKMIGAGADIHMGLWDGNKYVDEKPEPSRYDASKKTLAVEEPDNSGESDAPFPEITGQVGRPTHKGEKNEAPTEYLFLQSTIRALRTENDLLDWIADETNKAAINKLPAKWIPNFREEYKDRLQALRAAA